MDVAVKYAVSCIIDQELEYAYKKHPEFPKGFEGTVIILEELGELAKECNDRWHTERSKRTQKEGDIAMAQEAAQVAVTAIRFLQTAVLNGLDVDAVLQAIAKKTRELHNTDTDTENF